MKHKLLILAAVYVSFSVIGMPDGAFGVAWPSIRADMGLRLELAGIAMLVQAFFYALTSSQLGRISRFIKLEKIDLIGISAIALGFAGLSIAPNFTVFVIMVAPVGIGLGLVDSSLNAYMVKSFSARHLNLLHCFWGLGAAFTPIFMTQIILISGWRLGYASLAVFQGTVAIFVFLILLKGRWGAVEKPPAESRQTAPPKQYLAKKRHQFIMVISFFFYGGIEYASGFWIASVLLESRGLALEVAGLYPAVFYASIMAGRLFFGIQGNKFSDTSIIRFGLSLAFTGFAILFITSNILGMALAGLGFAPIFPCLIHNTSNRFDQKILTKLVGYEVAACVAGGAVLASLIGRFLAHVSLEALFPIVMITIVLILLMNELLDLTARKTEKNSQN